MKPSPRLLFISLIAVAGLVVLYIFIVKPLGDSLGGIPTAADAGQASSLRRFVMSRVIFDGKSATDPTQPPVYCDPFRNSARLTVYGITNTERQEEVLSAVREWQMANRNMSKLSVRFYEREKWREVTNTQTGDSGGERLPEVMIREIAVVLSNEPPNKSLQPTATAP